MTPELLERILRPIKNKVYNIIGRAIVTALDNSGKTLKVQVQVFGVETFDGIDVLQNYGFESLADAADNDNEALLSSIGGNRIMSVVTAVHNREHRPKDLAAGEACLYTKFGQRITLKADGSVLVKPAAGKDVLLYDVGGQPVMLETIITKLNNHVHLGVTVGGAATGTMAAGGTTLVAGTDSATYVKAKA